MKPVRILAKTYENYVDKLEYPLNPNEHYYVRDKSTLKVYKHYIASDDGKKANLIASATIGETIAEIIAIFNPDEFTYDNTNNLVSINQISWNKLTDIPDLSVHANNGLNTDNGPVQLGGDLLQNTVINYANNKLTFKGVIGDPLYDDYNYLELSTYTIKFSSYWSPDKNSYFEMSNSNFSYRTTQYGDQGGMEVSDSYSNIFVTGIGGNGYFSANRNNSYPEAQGAVRYNDTQRGFKIDTTGITMGYAGLHTNDTAFKGLFIGTDKNLTLHNYPNTRNDGSTLNALYVDASGNLKHGPVNLGNAGQNGGNFIWNQYASAQTANGWINGKFNIGAVDIANAGYIFGVYGNMKATGHLRAEAGFVSTYVSLFGNSFTLTPSNGQGLSLGWNNSGGGGESNIISYYSNIAGSNYGDLAIGGHNGTTYTEWARFNKSGKFGLGTNNPAYTLDVAGTGRFTGQLNATAGISLTGTTVPFDNGAFSIGNDTNGGWLQTWGGKPLRLNPQGNSVTTGGSLTVGTTATIGNVLYLWQQLYSNAGPSAVNTAGAMLFSGTGTAGQRFYGYTGADGWKKFLMEGDVSSALISMPANQVVYGTGTGISSTNLLGYTTTGGLYVAASSTGQDLLKLQASSATGYATRLRHYMTDAGHSILEITRGSGTTSGAIYYNPHTALSATTPKWVTGLYDTTANNYAILSYDGTTVVSRLQIQTDGGVLINNLTGTGTRIVGATSAGVLTTTGVAQNGVNTTNGPVELGGALIRDTNIDAGAQGAHKIFSIQSWEQTNGYRAKVFRTSYNNSFQIIGSSSPSGFGLQIGHFDINGNAISTGYSMGGVQHRYISTNGSGLGFETYVSGGDGGFNGKNIIGLTATVDSTNTNATYIPNVYAVYAKATRSGTQGTVYAIYSDGGINYFKDDVTIASTATYTRTGGGLVYSTAGAMQYYVRNGSADISGTNPVWGIWGGFSGGQLFTLYGNGHFTGPKSISIGAVVSSSTYELYIKKVDVKKVAPTNITEAANNAMAYYQIDSNTSGFKAAQLMSGVAPDSAISWIQSGYFEGSQQTGTLVLNPVGGNIKLGTLTVNDSVDYMVGINNGILKRMTIPTGSAPTAPAGSNMHVQFNNSGAFGASSNFIWDNTNKRQEITGDVYVHDIRTVGSGGTQLDYTIADYTVNGLTGNGGGAVVAASIKRMDYNLTGGSWSMDYSSVQSANFNWLRLRTTELTTISVTQATDSIRALSANAVQVHLTADTYGSSISHVAGMQIYGIYQTASNSVSIANYYGLLIGNQEEYLTDKTKVTNRWGVYQAGPNEKNYFGGKVEVKNDIEIIGNTKSLILPDTANSNRYKVQITNGAITITQII